MGFDFVIPMSALKAASESVQAHERLVYELKNEGNTKGRSELSLSVVLWYSPTLPVVWTVWMRVGDLCAKILTAVILVIL